MLVVLLLVLGRDDISSHAEVRTEPSRVVARRQLHPLKFDRSQGPVARVVAPRRGTRVRGMLLPVS